MKTNLIKTELTHAQILNPQLNGGYYLNAKDLDNLCFKNSKPYGLRTIHDRYTN